MQSISRSPDPTKAVAMRAAPTKRLLSVWRMPSAESSRKRSGGKDIT